MKKTHQMVERALIDGLLKGDPKPGSLLQSERDLAVRFAVSRATVREALAKLQSAGWISVQQRHATVVNDFWSHGDLEILSSISRNSEPFPLELSIDLLELRCQLAPEYARKAVEKDAAELSLYLGRASKVRNSSTSLLKYDWELHLTMAVLSGNHIYPLIMNSFTALYMRLKGDFFSVELHRTQAREFYKELSVAVAAGSAEQAEKVTRAAMKVRLENFKRMSELQSPGDSVKRIPSQSSRAPQSLKKQFAHN
jgi:GntR family transcriptional regulator, negative regulator for fad regulon and positive regulator of fabA